MLIPSRAPLRHAVLLLAAMVFPSACSGGNAASNLAKAPEFAPKDQSKCGVTRSQAEPLIIEWPDAARGKLEAQIRRGLVAVRYIGCEMEVLGQCSAKGSYGYAGLTRKRSRVTMKDADELYANIPAGAARLEGKLAKAGELNVTMMIVGRLEADKTSVRADELQGNCAGATHLITAVTVGQFDFFAGADAEVGAGATIAGAGVGGKSAAKREMLNQDGEEAACLKSTAGDKAAPDGCGALLRIEVVPLGEAKLAEPSCPPGTRWDGKQCAGDVSTACAAGLHFEAGRGCAPDVAAVSPAAASPFAGSPAATPPAPAPAPAPSGGACPVGMASLPGGSFTMGTKESVSVNAFCLDLTEVTVDAYTACVRSGKCSADVGRQFYEGQKQDKGACNWGRPGRGNHPINCVDWDQSTTYCQAQGKRLATEREWEWAARGGARGSVYPWGSEAPGRLSCWAGDSKRTGTCAVGTFPQGDAPGGIHDLAGGVTEWTSSDVRAGARVLRGGSWGHDHPTSLRADLRSPGTAPENREDSLGFRCARSN